jgi:hypothetical protein
MDHISPPEMPERDSLRLAPPGLSKASGCELLAAVVRATLRLGQPWRSRDQAQSGLLGVTHLPIRGVLAGAAQNGGSRDPEPLLTDLAAVALLAAWRTPEPKRFLAEGDAPGKRLNSICAYCNLKQHQKLQASYEKGETAIRA